MFFSRPDEILALSRLSGITIFSFPSDFDYTDFIPKNILQITPQEKSTISIEEIRQLDSLVHSRQDNELFIIVHPAESLTEAAMNACLKTIESPQSNVHFIFFSKHPNLILPTIHSRAHHYSLKTAIKLDAAPNASPEQISIAKQLIAATPAQLIVLANDISKSKPDPRKQALSIIDLSIQLLYKSYFKTGDPKFLIPLARFIKAYQAIASNGHIKLQLIASLLP